MAASAKLFHKYIWLADLIYSSQPISFKEIENRWSQSSLNDDHETHIPLRTFHHMRQNIEELFQICIECDKSTNTYYIPNADKIRTNKTQQWLLNTFAVTNLIYKSQHIQDKILLEDMPSDSRFLSTIIEAMSNGYVLDVQYLKFKKSASEEDHSASANHLQPFEMRPYCVKAFKQRWYMVGESSNHPGEVRVYALDRVQSMHISKKTYTIPENFDAQTYFSDYYGIIRGDGHGIILPEKVVVHVNYQGANYMRSLPLHASQEEVIRTPEYSIFEFFIAPTFDFIQQLRTYGEELRVLHPQSLADEFRKLGVQYTEMYATPVES